MRDEPAVYKRLIILSLPTMIGIGLFITRIQIYGLQIERKQTLGPNGKISDPETTIVHCPNILAANYEMQSSHWPTSRNSALSTLYFGILGIATASFKHSTLPQSLH
jgi:xanthine/uracil/vitamin C permease (AzgA family)